MNKLIPVLVFIWLWTFHGAVSVEAAGVGVVTGLRGQATVQHERDPKAQALKFKDDIFWQDRLSTGTDTQLRLLILQKNVITMKELTQLQLREDLVSPNQPRKKSVVDLISGAVRVAVDKDALKEGDYEVRTNMAVAAIRGSDLFGQTSGDRVEFCSGPGSHVTAIHQSPAVGRKELDNLQCASVFPDRIDVRNISLSDYRTLTNIGPRGSQNSDHGIKSAAKLSLPPGGDGPKGPNNPYDTKGCLLCNPKTKLGPLPPPP